MSSIPNYIRQQNKLVAMCRSLEFSIVLIAFISMLAIIVHGLDDRFGLDGRTKFIIYDKNNEETLNRQCYASKRYAMIIHGWQESCNTFWVKDLRQNLLTHRGGCIICMDYSDYNREYSYLVIHFKLIVRVLLNKLRELRDRQFSSSHAYLFGFSFGSRLITQAAMDFGPKQLGTAHLCEPAGPGFDLNHGNAEPRLAVQHSQCIHTDSKGHGTTERTCHQDWILGDCGDSQIAAGPRPLGNHGLCPVFYNHAFKHKYLAVKKSKTCSKPIDARDAQHLPTEGIRMGYFQKMNNSSNFNGVNLYVSTKRNPPYV